VPFELFNEPWVLFRDEDGRPSCVRDECAHRACPLSLGKVVEGHVQCAYHGWEFAGDGTCTKMPSTVHCRNVAVAALPCVEKDGFIWVWPGQGEPPEVSLGVYRGAGNGMHANHNGLSCLGQCCTGCRTVAAAMVVHAQHQAQLCADIPGCLIPACTPSELWWALKPAAIHLPFLCPVPQCWLSDSPLCPCLPLRPTNTTLTHRCPPRCHPRVMTSMQRSAWRSPWSMAC
jgi:nitrite reductase/ring-hydroxylating ferredoxin subunit